MSALVAVDDLRAEVARVREMAAWVAGAPAVDAAEVTSKADQARKIIKAMNGAAELGLEASKLECIALRRLGQLGEPALAGRKKHIAVAFGAMNETEFASVLADLGPWSGAWGAYQRVAQERYRCEQRQTGRDVGEGRQCVPVDPRHSIADLAQAAGVLLDEYAASGVPFSPLDVATEIAADFGVLDSTEAAVREGLLEAVRLAVRADNGGESDTADPDAPAWVTYREDEAGWVRIPFRVASADQFRAMVDLRREQVRDLTAALARLERVLTIVDAASAVYPDDPCGTLVRFPELANAS